MPAVPNDPAEAVTFFREAAAARGIPGHMTEGIARYMVSGGVTGGFLAALLSNDLMEAMGRADDANLHALPAYGMFLYNDAPMGSYGSPATFRDWQEAGGLVGKGIVGVEAIEEQDPQNA